MKLDNDQTFAITALANSPIAETRNNPPTTSFADELSAQAIAAKNIAARDEVIASQSAKNESLTKEDIEFIREHGMQAYVDKVREEKIEELRAKLLENMNITEEMLAAMPPDQRKTIEDIIDRMIQQQLAANSIVNSDTDGNKMNNLNFDTAGIVTPNNIQAQLMASNPGSGSGDIMSDVLEHSQTLSSQDNKDQTG
ncbi:MAG: hypothetical protein HON65_04095 [Rhodospirillales bacterium]|jgi:hypothetical protein|nr:hypothetical protein [Rhodospirillales bacterium]